MNSFTQAENFNRAEKKPAAAVIQDQSQKR